MVGRHLPRRTDGRADPEGPEDHTAHFVARLLELDRGGDMGHPRGGVGSHFACVVALLRVCRRDHISKGDRTTFIVEQRARGTLDVVTRPMLLYEGTRGNDVRFPISILILGRQGNVHAHEWPLTEGKRQHVFRVCPRNNRKFLRRYFFQVMSNSVRVPLRLFGIARFGDRILNGRRLNNALRCGCWGGGRYFRLYLFGGNCYLGVKCVMNNLLTWDRVCSCVRGVITKDRSDLIVRLARLVLPTGSVTNKDVSSCLLTYRRNRARVRAIVELRFVIRRAQRRKIVVEASTARAINRTSGKARTERKVLRRPNYVVPYDVLEDDRFRVLPVFAFNCVVNVKWLMFRVLRKHSVARRRICTFTISVAIKNRRCDFHVNVHFLRYRAIVVLVVGFDFARAPFVIMLGTRVMLRACFQRRLQPARRAIILKRLYMSPCGPQRRRISPVVIHHRPKERVRLAIQEDMFHTGEGLRLRLFRQVVDRQGRAHAGNEQRTVTIVHPTRRVVVPMVTSVTLCPRVRTRCQ